MWGGSTRVTPKPVHVVSHRSANGVVKGRGSGCRSNIEDRGQSFSPDVTNVRTWYFGWVYTKRE